MAFTAFGGAGLVLPREMVGQLRGRARAAQPAECCGLIIARDEGRRRVVDRLVPIANDDADVYRIEPGQFAAAETTARAEGAYVGGVYHSHPRGPALPSARDAAAAWPGLDYVIVGCDGAVRAWRLDDDRCFSETRLEERQP